MVETELLTPKECSEYRRCSLRKLDCERAERRGCPYVRIDGRIFYRRSDVDCFIGAHVCGGDLPDTEVAPDPRRRGRPRKVPTGERHIEAQVRGGEFRAADAAAGPQPRRRRQPRKPPASEAMP